VQSNTLASRGSLTYLWDGSGSWFVAVVFPGARGGPGGGNWPSLVLLWYSGLRPKHMKKHPFPPEIEHFQKRTSASGKQD